MCPTLYSYLNKLYTYTWLNRSLQSPLRQINSVFWSSKTLLFEPLFLFLSYTDLHCHCLCPVKPSNVSSLKLGNQMKAINMFPRKIHTSTIVVPMISESWSAFCSLPVGLKIQVPYRAMRPKPRTPLMLSYPPSCLPQACASHTSGSQEYPDFKRERHLLWTLQSRRL